MKTLIWKIRYAFEIRALLCVPLRACWDMAESAVENLGDDINDCTPKEAAEEERDEWLACC